MRRLNCALAAATLLTLAAPASAASTTAVTTVNVIKPAVLSKLQDLDFGTLTFAGFKGTRTVTIGQNGVLSCAAEVVCSGTARPARFNLQGTNKMTANITVTGGTLSNGVDSIPFTHSAPTSIYMPNSGSPGIDFAIGGSIVLSPTLAGGVYSGTMNVTAEYQ